MLAHGNQAERIYRRVKRHATPLVLGVGLAGGGGLVERAPLQASTLVMSLGLADGWVVASDTPLTILGATGLTWLRSDLGVLDGSGVAITEGGSVGTWQDLSGNGHHLTQGTAARRPVWSATSGKSSRPGITFDGVAAPNNDFLRGTWTWNQPAHVWIVVKMVTAGTGANTVFDGSAGNTHRLYFNATQVRFQTSAAPSVDKALTQTSFNFLETRIDGAGNGYLNVNGGGSPATNTGLGAGNPGGLILGSFGDQSAGPANCVIVEYIAKTTIQSADKVVGIKNYLEGRYGAF
jgi:hypothetical protein